MCATLPCSHERDEVIITVQITVSARTRISRRTAWHKVLSMADIKLKKILSGEKTREAVSGILASIGVPIGILDASGALLAGKPGDGSPKKFPIAISGDVIGWAALYKHLSELTSYLNPFCALNVYNLIQM